ncbi:ATP-grasp domain-containing protein [Nitratireductor aquibiodomus]|uniref:ATP-grasp domain-containing protein n=1 Tax=Nitratireductor aquibiodomus TaxID=204799 RepID=UPI0009DFAD8C|nr:ATP-grasp domain-containing protein [Nitratireductor aquibiodomus]
MNGRRTLLIGAGREMCDTALANDMNFLLVETPKRLKPDLLKAVPEALIMDYEDQAALRRLIAPLHAADPFHSVVSLTEPGLQPAAEIAGFLGLSDEARHVVEGTRDKYLMRQRLNAAGVDDLEAIFVRSNSDIIDYLKCNGAPVIVKPVNGQASQGVTKIETREEAGMLDLSGMGGEAIAEPFLTGPEYSVEAFSFSGRHVVIAITQKLLAGIAAENPLVEAGHVMPAPLPTADRQRVCEYIAACLDALGFRDGPSHTEIKLTDRGPRIIETHNRVGGDCIINLLLLSHELDILEYVLKWPLGLAAPLPAPPISQRAAAIKFLLPRPGRVKRIAGQYAARWQPRVADLQIGIIAGDEVAPIRDSFDRPGHVICVGDTPEEAMANCDRALATIQIEIQAS